MAFACRWGPEWGRISRIFKFNSWVWRKPKLLPGTNSTRGRPRFHLWESRLQIKYFTNKTTQRLYLIIKTDPLLSASLPEEDQQISNTSLLNHANLSSDQTKSHSNRYTRLTVPSYLYRTCMPDNSAAKCIWSLRWRPSSERVHLNSHSPNSI
jgi:hypothetical protein